eukprot:3656735-Alexandrium_andersonii.AAC.1
MEHKPTSSADTHATDPQQTTRTKDTDSGSAGRHIRRQARTHADTDVQRHPLDTNLRMHTRHA